MPWYIKSNGSPKSHNCRSCPECRALGYKGGCILPFRKMNKVRYNKNLDIKPMFFGSLFWNKFLKGE